MKLLATHNLTVTSTPAALPAHGAASLPWMVLIRNTGDNALTVAAAEGADGFSVAAGDALRLPCDRPEEIYLTSASGTTADVAYFA